MAGSFFEILVQRERGLIGAGVRWISPWVRTDGIGRQFVIARVQRT